jgi:hypothetical protein
MKFLKSCLPVFLLLISSSGCVTVKECCDQCMVDCRNRCLAEKAWWSCKSCYSDVDCPKDFGRGFKDGYVAVASGGGTCQPALPAERYWHFCYENPCGQEQQLAWFNGYTYGAIYAEQEGVGDWTRVVTAPTLPPYRKKRPAKASAAAADDYFPSAEPATPYAEPMPADEAPPVPDPSASNKPPVVEEIPSSNSQARAARTSAGWTEPFDSY